jgi:regulator of sirC expression with transglutaminase-like and TPR domain
MLNNEIRALISLLDDPDTSIFDDISQKIIAYGGEVIPELESAWENSFDHLAQTRIEDIIHHLQFENNKLELTNWKNNPEKNLIEGAIIVAKYQYPDLEVDKIRQSIKQITQDVWLELNDNLTGFEKVNVLNRIIFGVHEFYGNTKNINSPKNSYINNVIERKKGNPITLGILYLAVCEQLNIPMFGVDVPGHFILAYAEDREIPLFYLNVFNKGTVFGYQDIDVFLEKLKVEPEDKHYIPCSSLEVIQRLIQHLVYTYDNLGYIEKKEELEELYGLLD